MFKLRVRFLEPFVDGNILEGRRFKPEEVVDMDEADAMKIQNSGGEIEVLETLVPNPLKKVVPPEEIQEAEDAGKRVKRERGKRAK